MPNVAEVIRDHVTLAVECVDRLYLNAYVPGLQRGPGVVAFLRQRGQVIASPALFGEITERIKSALQQYCSTRNLPWIEFSKGQDKDKLVESYRLRASERSRSAVARPIKASRRTWPSASPGSSSNCA